METNHSYGEALLGFLRQERERERVAAVSKANTLNSVKAHICGTALGALKHFHNPARIEAYGFCSRYFFIIFLRGGDFRLLHGANCPIGTPCYASTSRAIASSTAERPK